MLTISEWSDKVTSAPPVNGCYVSGTYIYPTLNIRQLFLVCCRLVLTFGGPGRNVFEPWEFLKFIVNFKDVSLRSNGFYQL